MAKKFEKLTRPEIRALPVGGKITEHGITFERLPDRDGVFTVNVMVDGERIHRVVGKESDGTTRTQAEEFIEKVRRDAKDNRLALPKGRKVALMCKDAADKYLKRLPLENGKDVKKKEERLDLHLIPFFGDRPLSKITTFDVERYKKLRTDEGANPATVNRELAVLSHLLNKSLEWGWLDKKPAVIKRFREGPGRITFLTIKQAEQLVAASKTDQNDQVHPFIVIALGTAMRRWEILSIRSEHVDVQRLVIHVPRAKAGPREQPITKQLGRFLAEYMKTLDSPWLFPSRTSKIGHTTNVRKAFRRVVTAAGMDPDKVTPHTLRHTAITHLVQVGVDLPTVKRVSGHKTLSMVERYSHQHGAHIEAAMDKLEERLKIS